MPGLKTLAVILGLIACFSTTFATMLWLKSRTAPPPAPVAVTPVVQPQVAPTTAAPKPAADVAALQEQLASKERIIERLQQELQQAQRPAPVTTERTEQRPLRTDGQPGGGRGFDMERLRTEDPERYAEIRERMRSLTEQMNNATNKRSEFIAGLDPKLVKAEDQENLAKLQDGMKRMAELTAQMQEAQTKGTDLDPTVRREMWELSRELQPLMGVARTAALTDLALQLGYKQDSASEFVEYVNELVEQTSLMGGMGRGGWGGGGPNRDGGDRTNR